jgi:hypothetical protein
MISMKLVFTGIKRQPVARFPRFRFDVLGAREMSKRIEGWGRRFDEQIELPDGGRLVTLAVAVGHPDYGGVAVAVPIILRGFPTPAR